MQNRLKKKKFTTIAAGLVITITPSLKGDYMEPLDWGLNNAAVTPEGYLDITKAPYSLKNDGTDEARNTTWLQNAIEDAYTHNLAIFFPEGTYKLNNQLDCFQEKSKLTDAHVFVGSAVGARPVIQLANGSTGFGNTNNPKSLFNYYCSVEGDGTGEEKPAAGYNFVIRGLDFDLGDNAGAIAVDLQAAQGCTIQDVSFSGFSFYAAIKDLCGSGGHHANLKVTGGKYAFYVSTSRPMPVLTGITCIDQTTRTFFTNPLTTITVVGFKFQQNTNIPIFDLNSSGHKEHLNLIDGSIEYTGPKATKAILNQNRSIYLRNVYVKNATTIVQNNQGANLGGDTNWSHVGDYNFFDKVNRQLIDSTYSSGSYGANTLTTDSAAPPTDLLSRHLWDESTFPHWEDTANVVSIGPGTAGDNDAARIQAVIDSADSKAVFLHKGEYYLETSIHLKSDTRLFGVSRNLTRLFCKPSFTIAAPDWGEMITTPDDANATCMLAWLAMEMPVNQADRVTFTNWKAGRHSMVREVHFRKSLAPGEYTNNDMKRLTISGNGGGRWYGVFFRNAARDGENPNHRMLYIDGTSEPLSLYAYTIEYQESLTYMTEIKDSSNISIYGLKTETDVNSQDNDPDPQFNSDGKYIPNPQWYRHTTPLAINNSTNIIIMGQSGLGEFENNADEGIIEIFGGSDQIMIANADGGWRDHKGYYLVQNHDDNKGLKKYETGAEKDTPAALYLKGPSPSPIVYTPPSGGGGGGGIGGSGEIQEFVLANIVDDSGKESETKTSANACEGEYALYKSNGVGDYIQFDGVVIPEAGEYDIYVTVQKGDNAGILQLQVNNARENVGNPVDIYNSTYGFERMYFGTKTYTSAGNNRKVAFEVTGKNASSNNYYTRIDCIEFVPTASNLYDNDCNSGNPDDDFNPINGSDMNNWSYTNGKLECIDSWKRIVLEQGSGWNDYTVDVDVEDLGGGSTSKEVSAVLLRCDGSENHYGVIIDKNNDLFIGKKAGSWTWSNPIPSGANHTDYNLSIDVSGSSTVNIDVYVNGSSTAVIHYTDSTNPHTTGGIGFEARGNVAVFDNITVQ